MMCIVNRFHPNSQKEYEMDKIIGFTLLIIVVGVILGLGLGDLNPWTSPAEARKLDAGTAYQAKLNELTLQEKEAQNAAEAKQAEQDLLQDQQIHEQSLANNQRLANTGRIMLIVFCGAVSTSIIILSIRMAIPKKGITIPVRQTKLPEKATLTPVKVRVLPAREPYDPWKQPEYQKSIIQQACDNEREKQDDELLNARLQAVSRPASRVRIISGKQYHRYPRAS
jgi:hypothetical protein